MKKVFSIFGVFLFLFSAVFLSKSYAQEVPGQMNPNAVIEFDERLNIILINPGDSTFKSENTRPYEKLDINKMSNEERERYFEEERIFKEAEEFSKTHPVTIVKTVPEAGMRVIYDGEGFIDDIIYTNKVDRYNPLMIGSISQSATYVWGRYNNKLVVKEKYVTITGRFAVFTDKIGERNNTFVKGDCAIRVDCYNPKYGQEINTRKLNKDLSETIYTHLFYKRDNGSLPDAILDIWKDGVGLLGESYSTTLSFMGRYYLYYR